MARLAWGWAALAFVAVPALVCPAATLPRKAPDISLQMVDGKPVQLGQFKGKVVALAFILTDCPHCQQAVNLLAKLQGEYGSRGFQAVASAIDDMAATSVPDFVRRFNPPFPVGYNPRNFVVQYLQHPSEERLLMPQIVVLDREGTIQAQYAADEMFADAEGGGWEQNLRMEIEQLLRKPAPVSKKGVSRRKKS